MRQQLHTPEGVRDIYNIECQKKNYLEKRLQQVLYSYGYHDIETPTFEYLDVFRKEIGTIPAKELYKFFDRDGDTLVLRPDITPSIARAAATLFDSEDIAIRLCYIGNTFVNHFSYRGRLKENTQLGAELIGIDTPEADAEMLALVIDCMKHTGLKEFQINVGNVDFFQSLLDDAQMNAEEEVRIRELINNRNYFGVEELLSGMQVKRSSREAFAALPELVGGEEVLAEAKKIAPNANALNAIKRLEMIYQVVKAYGVEQYLTFDLSMSGTYGYYTGIIFRGYTFGTGDAVVKGGRYDHLLEKFGKQSPSIGFAIVVNELMSALTRQKIEIEVSCQNTLVIYDANRQKEAILLAKEFRSKGKPTELLKKTAGKTVEDYVNYGLRNQSNSLIYLQESDQLRMINLLTGEQKIIKSES